MDGKFLAHCTRRGTSIVAFAALLLVGAGCDSGIVRTTETTKLLENCGQAVQGQRYAVCGRLATANLGGANAGGLQIMGAVDSASASTSGSRYAIQGGTFHVAR